MSICSVVLFLIQIGYQLYILKMNLTRKDQLLCTEIYTVVNVTNFVIAKHMTTWRRQENKYFQRKVLYHVFFTLTKVLIGCLRVCTVMLQYFLYMRFYFWWPWLYEMVETCYITALSLANYIISNAKCTLGWCTWKCVVTNSRQELWCAKLT